MQIKLSRMHTLVLAWWLFVQGLLAMSTLLSELYMVPPSCRKTWLGYVMFITTILALQPRDIVGILNANAIKQVHVYQAVVSEIAPGSNV